MVDYSHLRMQNHGDLQPYIKKMGNSAFFSYCEKIFETIEKLQPGQSFKVDSMVVEENREMFIKILHCFIIDFNFTKYTFNNTYTSFRRYGKEETLQLESARRINKARNTEQNAR
jgi:hypothetical protein